MKNRWTNPALRDLEIIGDYLTGQSSPDVAARIVTAILDRAEALVAHPHIGRPGRVPDTRELVVTGTPYIVPYRVCDMDLQILAVFHGARRWPDKFD